MPSGDPRPAKRSEARERLLSAASELFYAEGINSVGVDRAVQAGRVTLATFYRHFPSKQDLVVAYLQRAHEQIAERVRTMTEEAEGQPLVRAIGDDVTAQLRHPGFRGCAFINAASEFENAESPVRRVVADHRRWYYEVLRRAFGEAGHPHAGNAARHFVMMRDGAMSAGYLDTTATASRTFKRGVEGLLRSIDVEALDAADDGEEPD